MAVTHETPRYVGGGRWRLAWSSGLGSPPPDGYRIYRDGALVARTDLEVWDFVLRAGEQLVVEVLDDDDLQPAVAFPGKLTFGWRRVAGAAEYRVEEYVAGLWVVRRNVPETGAEWLEFTSRYLEDDATHQFRVTPVGKNGNEGTPVSFAVLMVRHPDTPVDEQDLDAEFSYSAATKKVTVL
jgi:hypothetical protein